MAKKNRKLGRVKEFIVIEKLGTNVMYECYIIAHILTYIWIYVYLSINAQGISLWIVLNPMHF
jgi:hypothetical protein